MPYRCDPRKEPKRSLIGWDAGDKPQESTCRPERHCVEAAIEFMISNFASQENTYEDVGSVVYLCDAGRVQQRCIRPTCYVERAHDALANRGSLRHRGGTCTRTNSLSAAR